jgi:outer membrane receptor protein involved in Fe transport
MFDGSFTFSDNKYIEYMVDSAHYNNPGHFADYSGNKAAGIPDVFYHAGITYSPDFFKSVYLNFNINGTGKYPADDANVIKVPAFEVFNASLGLNQGIPLSKSFFIKGFVSVNNIADKKYAASAFINPDINENGEPVYLEPGLPRSFVVSVAFGAR